ncbi:hypothetical protein H3V53_31510 [Paraburkholderia bengalensis]|uniref:Uncharacterized protein n=1 Tax=Paraburkholderia bengalensis TaxID=2747562 RepID=A0ABU8J0S3_9BURK
MFHPGSLYDVYDKNREETQTVSYHHVAQAAVADAIAKSTGFEVLLADFDYRIDDAFARRRMGTLILKVLAGRSVFLKEHLSITTEHPSPK